MHVVFPDDALITRAVPRKGLRGTTTPGGYGEGCAMIDFGKVNAAAIGALPSLLDRWLPGGRRQGREYVVRNPRRADRTAGRFRINMITGRWADFATSDSGGDLVSLAAYLFDLSQFEAARRLAAMLGMQEK